MTRDESDRMRGEVRLLALTADDAVVSAMLLAARLALSPRELGPQEVQLHALHATESLGQELVPLLECRQS